MPDDPPVSGEFTPLDIARQAELLELTQDAVLVRDVRTSAITYWNHGAERLYGWSRDEARGQITHTFLNTRFPETREIVDQDLLVVDYWEGELLHTRKDGTEVVVASRQAVQRDPRGTPVAILEINTNITERKRAEAEQLRLAAEQRARQLAERALDHLARLQRVTAGLAEALTPREVAEVVVEQSVAALGARSGRVSLLRPDGDAADVIAAAGYTWVRTPLPLDEPIPANEVMRTGQALFASSYAEVSARFPRLGAAVDPVIAGGSASVPLIAAGHVIGAMTIVFEGDREFADDDRELLIAMATQCAEALERARLYELSLSVQEDLRSSRDQLAAILGGIAEGVTVQDATGKLIFANAIAAELCGFASPEEFLRDFADVTRRFELFDEAGNPFNWNNLPARRLLIGAPPQGEVVVQYNDRLTGERRWSVLDATPVLDDAGRPYLVVNIFRDVTERKRQTDTTELLAAAGTILADARDVESGLQQVAELAVPRLADWFIVDLVQPEGRVRRVAVSFASTGDAEVAEALRARERGPGSVSSSVERVLRSGRGQLISEWSLSPERWRSADSEERRRLLTSMQPRSRMVVPLVARGQSFGTVTLATTRSGRRFGQADFALASELATRLALAIDNARLYREAQEQAEHQSVLNVALRETVDERDRALTDLQQALRTRDEFLASASHDLKNPLASIKATAQLLRRRTDRPEPLDLTRLREGLQRIDAIASRAAGVVEELLDLARMQMGAPLDLDRQSADLAHLTRDVIAEQQAAERHPIEMQLEVEALVGAWDGRRLARVLTNLLDNAVKYTPDGGPILVRLRRDGNWAILDVSDRGIGIPRADLARIFERFQRASNVAGRIGGTGIGLASARHIVESHGGSIGVTSSEGQGSTFSVRLPMERLEDQEMGGRET